MEILSKMLNSDARLNQWLLAKVINRAIPFNKPHDFSVLKNSEGMINVKIPYIKKNKNHLNGIHACAMATGGELVAGLNLIKEFSPKKYRLIMSELNVQYHKQGKSHLICESSLNEEVKSEIEEGLNNDGKFFIKMKTYLKDEANQLIATVTTDWQLKDWAKIKKK